MPGRAALTPQFVETWTTWLSESPRVASPARSKMIRVEVRGRSESHGPARPLVDHLWKRRVLHGCGDVTDALAATSQLAA